MQNHFIQRFDYDINPLFNVYPSNIFTEKDDIIIFNLINQIDSCIILGQQEKNYFFRTLLKKKIVSLVNQIRTN
jgi:hypothetical protein